MTTLARRDDAELARGFTEWCAHRWPDAGYVIARLERAAGFERGDTPEAKFQKVETLVTVHPPLDPGPEPPAR